MELPQDIYSYLVFHWTAWKRWWRHPEREFVRRQLRRSILFWTRSPWVVVLVGIIIFKIWFLLWTRTAFGASGRTMTVTSSIIFTGISVLVPLVNIIVWANCMQDEGMNYFRGKRLGELLSTPAGPQRYFPVLLIAPIACWGAISLLIGVMDAGMSLWLLIQRHPSIHYDLFPWFNRSLAAAFVATIWRSLLGFLTLLMMMAGITALAASFTIGKERTNAMIHSILIAIAVLVISSVLMQVVMFLTFRYISIFWRSINFHYYFTIFYVIGISLVMWRIGMRRLRGPKTIERLQRAMESAK